MNQFHGLFWMVHSPFSESLLIFVENSEKIRDIGIFYFTSFFGYVLFKIFWPAIQWNKNIANIFIVNFSIEKFDKKNLFEEGRKLLIQVCKKYKLHIFFS